MPRSLDPTALFTRRIANAVDAAQGDSVDDTHICNTLATTVVQLSVSAFGVQGARRGLQHLLMSLSHLDNEQPPRLGGNAVRIAPVGRRRA